MTYAEAVQFLYDLRLFGAKFGLENTLKLAALAGNPQEKLRFIHVAGTNGKGSTCAMLESIYRAAGLRTGLFTSPHLVSFRERIQVNRQLISEDEVVRLVEEMQGQSRAGFQPAVEPGVPPGGKNVSVSQATGFTPPVPGGRMPPSTSGRMPDATVRQDACPTFFEFVTVMALQFFAQQKCDLVIWETGLGGRLDATNIVTPLASVITNIAFDHEQWLGDTLQKIAAEKAGIIKLGVPVITATDEPAAMAVIEETARGKKAPLVVVKGSDAAPRRPDSAARCPNLSLLGDHQQLNAALAQATVEVLQNKIPASDETIRLGLTKVDWPGRLQLVRRPSGRKILLDGAHNVAGAKALRAALEKDFRFPGHTLILGVLQDKDWRHICEMLAPLAARIFTVPVASARSANARDLAAACRAANPKAEVAVADSLGDALGKTERDDFVLVTGSLYLVGEVLEWLGLSPAAGGERELNEWSARPLSLH